MEFAEYRRHDATALAALVREREVSALELLEIALARAMAVQSALQPLSLLEEGFGRAEIARGLPTGPFTGVPFLLKDLFAFLPGT
ncbi:MAG: amidase, partial [Geminicoccaceae bacterium]|nr:amidase [Geminicoccaceae bacterium]